ncbi:hypothetical protein ACFC1T_09285 [Kitasatospora sp. NPDC056076]|uniref:hypothetical protein n=1 Tax=Kitasatospora sp. NPDC056076 TaxID=3345703 RepID=UPI0035D875F6
MIRSRIKGIVFTAAAAALAVAAFTTPAGTAPAAAAPRTEAVAFGPTGAPTFDVLTTGRTTPNTPHHTKKPSKPKKPTTARGASRVGKPHPHKGGTRKPKTTG